jgi:KaiC/GvpD/RAD55 family RecA-like ATPase
VGPPGTGKTFRLLQIGIMHARENAKVLFCCFNQVLASDINRILNLLDISFKSEGDNTLFKELIDVIDILNIEKI